MAMHLEIIPNQIASKGGAADGRAPFLLIHGAWHSAVCWREFAEYLGQQGRSCYAVSLRGHGGSENDRALRMTRLDGYVDDVGRAVAETAQQSGQKPVLIGHSMGGLVVQRYLERDHEIPRAILLAPCPVQGAWRASLRFLWRHPLVFLRANLTWRLWHLIATPALAREALFSEDIAPKQLAAHFTELQDESYMAFLDMLVFRLPRPRRVRTEVLVLGAANDAIFSAAEIRATGKAYGTEARIFDNMAHNMMLEQDWQQVADHILANA